MITFAGMSGNFVLDRNGDREPDYVILDVDPEIGLFVKIAEVQNRDNGLRVNRLQLVLFLCFVRLIQ